MTPGRRHADPDAKGQPARTEPTSPEVGSSCVVDFRTPWSRMPRRHGAPRRSPPRVVQCLAGPTGAGRMAVILAF